METANHLKRFYYYYYWHVKQYLNLRVLFVIKNTVFSEKNKKEVKTQELLLHRD